MKILVTGGAGFIGSHTCDRLLALGHDVVVLDALTPPVHRSGRPAYLSPEVDFYQGDIRNRDLVTNLLRRVDAVYHFAAYQDYLPDFSRFSDVNVVSTALLYEIIVAERLDLARVVVASSQVGDGRRALPVPDRRRAGTGDAPREGRSPRVSGTSRARSAAARSRCRPRPSGSPIRRTRTACRSSAQEMVAINLGRRYGIPTVALRYSIVQGPRQSVYNAYSGACRIFCLSYLQGMAPTLYEDGEAIRDYVNIDDVVDANVLVLEDDRAAGRVFNVGGGKAVTTREFADIVMRQYGSDQPGVVTGEYRFGDTRHILSGHQRPAGPGLGTAAHAGRLGRGLRRLAQGHGRSRRGAGRGERADARSRGRPEGGGVKAFLLAAGVGSRLRPITDTTPEVHAGHRRPAPARHLARRVRPRGRRRGPGQSPPPAGRGAAPHRRAQPGRLRSARSSSRNCSAAPARSLANREWVDGEEFFLACYADNLTDFDLRSLIDAHREHGAIATLTVFHSRTRRPAASWNSTRDGRVIGFAEKPSRAGFRPDQCRHVRLPPERAR